MPRVVIRRHTNEGKALRPWVFSATTIAECDEHLETVRLRRRLAAVRPSSISVATFRWARDAFNELLDLRLKLLLRDEAGPSTQI